MKEKQYFKGGFRKILLPVVYGCNIQVALEAANAIGGDHSTLLAGLIPVGLDDSLSQAALQAQQMRTLLHSQVRGAKILSQSIVGVAHNLWPELVGIAQKEHPDLMILEWPCCLQALEVSLAELLVNPVCDLAILRAPIPALPKRLLVPIRGGPYAELALRIALSFARNLGTQVTILHITPTGDHKQSDAPFRGIAKVLEHLPDLERLEMESDHPAKSIMDIASNFDLIVIGAATRPTTEQVLLGQVAEHLLNESPTGVMIVKTKRPAPIEVSEVMGQGAISVLVDKWFAENTFHGDEFSNLTELVELKQRQNVTISLAMPALNEAETVGLVISTIKNQLMDRYPLLDEMVLIDSDSTDSTREIAIELGIPIFIHQHLLPQYGARQGKGEALWKSQFVTSGDILLWIDTDIVNIHPRFIYGLIGPLLINPRIQFVKGFYRRPIKVGNRVQAGGGGRVTELTARPLINLFFPELSGVIQPLSGEYGGRRAALEQLPFFSGYGVEIGLLIEILSKFGLSAIAQVDLQERIHHNQPLESLSKMSFSIIQAVFSKMESRYSQRFLEDVNKTMKLIRYETGRLYLDVEEITELERPAMVDIPEYQLARLK